MKNKLSILVIMFIVMLTLSSTALAAKTYTCDLKADKTAGWVPLTVKLSCKTNMPNIQSYQWMLTPYNQPKGMTHGLIRATSTTPYVTCVIPTSDTYNMGISLVSSTGGVYSNYIKYSYITTYENKYTANALVSSKPKIITFAYTGNGNPTSFSWNFGDKSTSTQKLITTHTYKSAGTYIISLKVTNSAGSSTVTQTVTVK